jgi:N-acetyl-anhydromuramyl-L-alanine amidase AmpD
MQIIDVGLKFSGPSPNGGEQKAIDAIILHHSASNGNVQSVHEYHKSLGWWGIGYHYYIRKDGTIYRGRPEKFVGSHAGSNNDYNSHSIGICFEGNFEVETPTEAQIKAGQWLIADIKNRRTIKEILGHNAVTATACPGKNFPMDKMLEQTKYTVNIGTYDTKAEAVAVARLLEKWFDTAQVNII